MASFGDCTEDNSSGLRNLSLPETHPSLAAGKGSNNSCCLQPKISAHAAVTGLHCAETTPTTCSIPEPPCPEPCSAGLSFTLPSSVFPHRQGWDLFLTGKGKQTGFCFKLVSILWCLMEVKVHAGFLFPSHTLGLEMNQLNKLLKARQGRQSPGRDISSAQCPALCPACWGQLQAGFHWAAAG